jgi:hypothetical protein
VIVAAVAAFFAMFGPPRCFRISRNQVWQALNDSSFGGLRRLTEKQAVFCIDIAKNPVGEGDLQHP